MAAAEEAEEEQEEAEEEEEWRRRNTMTTIGCRCIEEPSNLFGILNWISSCTRACRPDWGPTLKVKDSDVLLLSTHHVLLLLIVFHHSHLLSLSLQSL